MKGELVKVPIGDPQKPDDYLVLRVQLVHVKKGWFGRLYDKKLVGWTALIANTRKEAVDAFNRIQKKFESMGESVYG